MKTLKPWCTIRLVFIFLNKMETSMELCPNRFIFIKNTQVLSIPCCWSHPIDAQNTGIARAIIVVHGMLRNADEYFPNMMEAVEQAGLEHTRLVIAPPVLDLRRYH